MSAESQAEIPAAVQHRDIRGKGRDLHKASKAKQPASKSEAVGLKKGAAQEKREIAKNLKALNLTKGAE